MTGKELEERAKIIQELFSKYEADAKEIEIKIGNLIKKIEEDGNYYKFGTIDYGSFFALTIATCHNGNLYRTCFPLCPDNEDLPKAYTILSDYNIKKLEETK